MSETAVDKDRTFRQKLLAKLVPLSIILAAVIGVLLVAAVLPAKDRDKPAEEPPPVNVTVTTIQPEATVADTFTLHGVLAPNRVVKVSAEVAGRVRRIFVEEGRPVRDGTVMVQLNDELIRPDRDRAQALATYYEKHYARIEDSLKQNVATERDLEEARMNRDRVRADLAAARARLDRMRIASPIDGILDRRPVELGQYVNAGDPVAEVVEIDPLKVVVQVPEHDVPYLRVGQPATISLDRPFPPKLTGTITLIRQQADPATRTVEVEITVPNPPAPPAGGQNPGGALVRKLRSGPIARVELTRQVLQDIVMIPLQAVISMEDRKVVYVVEDGLARQREVQVEMRLMRDWKVQVKGLVRGEQLIVAGHRYVAPDKPVRVEKSVPAAEAGSGSASQPASAKARGAG